MPTDRDTDWYLQEWVTHVGKIQASLIRELGWDKAKASFFWNGKRPYRRDVVNEVSRWLGIRPYELLMHPREALSLRRLRETAVAIAAEEEGRPFEGPAPADRPRRRRA